MPNMTLVNADNQTVVTGWNTTGTGLLPTGATQKQIASSVVSAAVALANLTGVPNKFTYITGFTVAGLGATAAGVIVVTISGTANGATTYGYPVPAGVGVAGPVMTIAFNPPLISNAVNTDISVSAASFGAGNVGAMCSAQGYVL